MLRNVFLSKRIRPSHIVGAIFILTVLLISEYAMTWSGGKTGQTSKTGSGNGCTCHCASGNASTSVTVTTGATSFEGGQTYTFTVSVNSSDGNHSHAGFNAAVNGGTLNVGGDATVQKIGDELTHTGPKALNASWSFNWTAPMSAGQVTMYVTANAVNNDGGNGGGNCSDKWNHATNFTMNVTVPNRSIALTRSSIAFGNVRLGQTKQDTLRIVSNGDASLTVSSSAMKQTTPYSASPTGTNRQLTVGTQEVNTITFNPSSAGTFVDTFVVNSNASTAADQRKTVVVSGTAVQAIFTGNTSFPFNNVKVGQTKDLAYTYQNTGTDTLFVTSANLQSSTFFSILGAAAATVPPGGTGTLNLRYAPTSKATHSTQLTFTAANNIATPTVVLTGAGVAPQLSALGLIQLGAIKIGATGSQNLDLENIGNDTLTITSVTIAPQYQGSKFSVGSGGTGTILPGAKRSVILGYQPTVLGNDTAKIVVASNDPTVPTREVLVMGRGALPAMKVSGPDTLKFGDVRVNSTATLSTVTIENTGEAELLITLLQATPDLFTIVSPITTVGGFANIPVQVKFSPTAEGVVTGMLFIAGDDAKFPRDTIYLSGRGTVSQFDTPSEINFGDVKMLGHRDSAFYLRNLGTAPVTISAYSIAGPTGAFTFQDTAKHTIPAHDSIAIKVRFTALDDISYAGTLTIRTTESANSTRTIGLLGRGIDSKLSLSDASLDFGEVDTMKTATKSVVITNTGTAAISINDLGLSGSQVAAFSKEHSALPKTLGPSDTMQVHLTFAPVVGGNHDAMLGITPAEGSSLNVLLHGIGVVDTSGSSVRSPYHLDVPFTLSPNPSRGAVTATFELMTTDELRFTVISIDGKLVHAIAAASMPAGKHEVRLDTDALANGEYLVRMTNRKGQFIEERFILVK